MKFNKMFVMVPVMLAARKIPTEDPDIVYWIRVAYCVVQFICLALAGYTYVQASSASKTSSADRLVYVPAPAMVRVFAPSRGAMINEVLL